MFYVFRKLHFIKVTETVEEAKDHKVIRYESTNFTIINFALTVLGPTHEKRLTFILLILQVKYSKMFSFFKIYLIYLLFKRYSRVPLHSSFVINCRNYFTIRIFLVILLFKFFYLFFFCE